MKSTITAKALKHILFGSQFKGKTFCSVFDGCKTLREEIGFLDICKAAGILHWLMITERLNPSYLLALQEGTAQQVCSAILSLRGVVGESNMIKAVESSIKKSMTKEQKTKAEGIEPRSHWLTVQGKLK